MPFYQISLIYRHGPKKGSTETYYRQAGSAREASDLGGFDGLAPWLDLRPSATTLQAVRAQEVVGLKRVFLRLCYFPGRKNTGTPETPGVAAKLRLFSDSGSRGLEFRGLVDEQVARDGFGHDRPGPGFLAGLDRLGGRMRELGLSHRSLVRNAKHQVKWYGLHPDSPDLSLIQTRQDSFVPAVGSYVDFGGGGLRRLLRSRGYLVMDSGPGFIAIFHEWGNVPDELGRGKVWVRQLEYSYHTFDGLEFTGFGTFATGPAYKPVSWSAREPWKSPLSPCGRITDFERLTHDGDMALWRDDPGTTTPVIWYFPEPIPGAALGQPRTVEEIPAVPYEHPFCSRLWEQDGDCLPVLGMRRTAAKNNGRPPILLRGIGLCGSREAWENGALATDPVRPQNPGTGSPCCCGPGVLLSAFRLDGGLVLGGVRPALAAVVDLAPLAGGLVLGGVMPEEAAVVDLAPLAGGLVLGGVMPVLAAVVDLAPLAGGLVLGGVMPEETEEGSGPEVTDCFACPNGAWQTYKVTISGATSFSAVWNGVWLADYIGDCTWYVEGPEEDSYLQFFPGDTGGGYFSLLVLIASAASADYGVASETECLGPSWLVELGSHSGSPGDWPATILVEAVTGEEEEPFAPADVAGLALWLDAAVGTWQDSAGTTPATADADPVGRWEDQSGNGRHATQATGGYKPTRRAAVVGGKPVVRFDGSDLLNTPSIALGPEFTIFGVVKASSISGTSLVAVSESGAPLFRFGLNTTESEWLGWSAVGTFFRDNQALTPTAWNVVAGVRRLAELQCYVNGTSDGPTSTTGTANSGSGAVNFGMYHIADLLPLTGDLAEFLIYDSALGDTDRAAIEAYLGAKYSL